MWRFNTSDHFCRFINMVICEPLGYVLIFFFSLRVSRSNYSKVTFTTESYVISGQISRAWKIQALSWHGDRAVLTLSLHQDLGDPWGTGTTIPPPGSEGPLGHRHLNLRTTKLVRSPSPFIR